MTHELMRPFEESISQSHQRLKGLSATGRKILGYFCTYTPVEILHASGFVPMRIIAGTGRMDKAGARLPDFICPFMKLSLENALDDRYDFLSGIVQGYSCDAACGLVNIWKDIFKDRLFHAMPIPYNRTPEGRAYYKSALFELTAKLDGIGGCFKETALSDSLDLYARIRSLQFQLYDRRRNANPAVSSEGLMAVVDAGSVTPPEQYLSMLENLVDQLPQDLPGARGGIPVVISGSLIEDPEILNIIESSGGRIAADDLCNGFRQISPPDGQGQTPMDRLMDRYMDRFPCPARSRAVHRAESILDLARDSSAKGVIFVIQKFCTPHLADIPTLSELLKKNGLPSIMIEMDETWQMAAQVKTRIEGFFEMMGGAA